jgi:hypothetical protein
MPFNFGGGSAFVHGQWRSPKLQYQPGSTSDTNSWLTLTLSGAEPADSTILAHVFDYNSQALVLGSQSLGSSPVTLSGIVGLSGVSLQVRIDAEWITRSPQLYWWTLDYVPTPLGDRRGALTTVRSGVF